MKSKTMQAIKEDASAARKEFDLGVTRVSNAMRDAKLRSENYVAANPKRSVAMAAGAGVLVGAAAVHLLKKRKEEVE